MHGNFCCMSGEFGMFESCLASLRFVVAEHFKFEYATCELQSSRRARSCAATKLHTRGEAPAELARPCSRPRSRSRGCGSHTAVLPLVTFEPAGSIAAAQQEHTALARGGDKTEISPVRKMR